MGTRLRADDYLLRIQRSGGFRWNIFSDNGLDREAIPEQEE